MGLKGQYRPRFRRSLRRLLAAGAALAVLSGTLPALPAGIFGKEIPLQVQAAESTTAKLRSLKIDRAYILEPAGDTAGKEFDVSGYSPDHFTYEATVYRSYDEVKIYPFAFKNGNASVTVNGQAVDGVDEPYTLSVPSPGIYSVEVSVTEGSTTNVYTIQVEKVNTDYRQRKPVVANEKILNEMKVVETSDGTEESRKELLKVLKLNTIVEQGSYTADNGIYWKPADSSGAYFVVDLGDVYDISRIRTCVLPRNAAGPQVSLWVSDQNVEWSQVDKSQMKLLGEKFWLSSNAQYHQDVNRYEFESQPVRYIKWQANTNVNNLQIHQFMIYEDTAPAPQTYDPPADGSIPWEHEERHQYLASGQATVIERGFPILGWMSSQGYGRGVPTARESEEFGWDGPLFYDVPQYNLTYLEQNPNSYWGLSKAPGGINDVPTLDPPGNGDLLEEALLPYIRNAISFCFGDERNYTQDKAQMLGKWFEYTRSRFPAVILHTNTTADGNNYTEANLKYYLSAAKPDMLTWDDYYNRGDGGNAAASNIQEQGGHSVQALFTGTKLWHRYRKVAMGGVDGSGNQPILYGQYLDTFQTNQPESIKNLIANLSVLSGQKWLNFFRVEYQFDRSFLWDEDGTPTTGTWEWGQVARRIHAVDEWTNRLNSDWILVKKGTGGNLGNDKYRVSIFVDPDNLGTDYSAEGLAKQQEYGIYNIAVTPNSQNPGGVTGDVAVGLANTLPGLYEDEIAEWFQGATAPKAFMLLNGLTDGTTGDDGVKDGNLGQLQWESSCYEPYVVERESGSAFNTRQTITVEVTDEFKNLPLYVLNPDVLDENGHAAVERVQLTEQNGKASFTAELGGGEMNVYFWGTNTTAQASSHDPHGTQAAFAFDNYPATYWQPAAAADGKHTLEKTFPAQALASVELQEKGNNIKKYNLYYQSSVGSWVQIANTADASGSFTDIGAVKTIKLNSAAQDVTGIRLEVLETDGGALPAIYEMQAVAGEEQNDTETVVAINDNDLGSGLYTFEYDGRWSYREFEDGTPPTVVYSRGGDGHVPANYNGATARFRFWGYKVSLDLRDNQMGNLNKLDIKILDKNGRDVTSDFQKTQNSGAVVYEAINGQDDAYVLVCKATEEGVELGIDGADVTRKSEPAGNIVFTNDAAPEQDTYQIYVNDKDSAFAYYNGVSGDGSPQGDKLEFVLGTNKFNIKGWSGASRTEESSSWVSYGIENSNEQNGGGARTSLSGAAYSFTFEGTSVAFYAGAIPIQKQTSTGYGTFQVWLDGVNITGDSQKLVRSGPEASSYQWRGGSAVELLKIEAGATDQVHTVVVSSSGYNRVDYAVVGRQTPAPKEITVNVSGGGGSVSDAAKTGQSPAASCQASLDENGNAAIGLHPDAGYRTASIVYNNVKQILPSDNRFLLAGASEGETVTVTFEKIPYKVSANPASGGSLAATVVTAREGDTVEAAVFPDRGYQLKGGTISAQQENGTPVPVSAHPSKEGWFTFTMPAGSVTLSAEFEPLQQAYAATGVVYGGTGGRVEAEQPQVPFLGDAVFTLSPDPGYRLASIRVNGVTKPLPEGNTYRVNDVREDITLTAYFEQAPETTHQVTAEFQGGQGFLTPSSQQVEDGADAGISFEPQAGFRLVQAEANGKPYPVATEAGTGNGKTLVIHQVKEDTEVKLLLAQGSGSVFALKAAAEGSGSVWPQTQDVAAGYGGVVLLYPDPGFVAESAEFNGKSYEVEGKDRLELPAEDLEAAPADAELKVAFGKGVYQISIEAMAGGSVAASPEQAQMGETVTLDVAAEEGFRYQEGSLTVLNARGEAVPLTAVESGRRYTFVMPDTAATVSASFVQLVQGISISPESLMLEKPGSTGQLTAAVLPEGVQAEVSWSSADGQVATVDSSGLVTAAGEGTTTVFAHAEGVSASCTVTVGKENAGGGGNGSGDSGSGDSGSSGGDNGDSGSGDSGSSGGDNGDSGSGNAGDGTTETAPPQAGTGTGASGTGPVRRPSGTGGQREEADSRHVTKTDESTDITLTGGMEEAWELYVEIVQAEAEETSAAASRALEGLGMKYAAYDIKLLYNGVEAQPSGSVEVRIPVPAGFDSGRLEVYHISEEGLAESLEFQVEDGYVVFQAEHFSIYVVAERAEEPAQPGEVQPEESVPEETAPEKVQPEESTAGEGTAVPAALIAVAVIVAAAAGGAGAFIYYKKKKKEK